MTSVATVVEATSAPMSARDKLRPLMDIIYKQVNPPECFGLQHGRAVQSGHHLVSWKGMPA